MKTSHTSFRAVAGAAASLFALAAGAVAVAATPTAAPDSVSVEFIHPEKFTDLQDQRTADERVRNAYMDDLRRTIERRAASELGPDRKLAVTITDVDMAGDLEFGVARGRDIRLMRQSSPPRIDLSFRLTDANGNVLKSGERHLTDLGYIQPERPTTDASLFFEKRLLSEWLDTELRR
jgi:hypothetical protein